VGEQDSLKSAVKSGFGSRGAQETFLFPAANQTTYQRAPSPEVKWFGRITNDPPSSSSEVMNTWSYTSASIRLN
jgi:hypothetical protein